jgi:hypothetical protein
MDSQPYPISFTVDYPDRPLNRLSTLLRIFAVIPILIVLGAVSGGTAGWESRNESAPVIAGTGGLLFLGPMLMIVFRQKYPRWWFDWNLELQCFGSRVAAYLCLMDDRYPATDAEQSVHLTYPYPVVERDLNRWLPLVKWFLAIPHLVVLAILNIVLVLVLIVAWVSIVISGRYPKELFAFVEGVLRWDNRVIGYAFTLVTDRYPPFRLSE